MNIKEVLYGGGAGLVLLMVVFCLCPEIVVSCVHFQSPLVLLTAIFPFVAWFLYRTVPRLILRRVWTYWCVRRAIDASFLGLLALSWMAFAHEWGDWAPRYSPEQLVTGDKIHHLAEVTYSTRYYAASEQLYQQYQDLGLLLDWRWFFENLANFVVLPACAVAFIGYSVQRYRQEKGKQAQKP